MKDKTYKQFYKDNLKDILISTSLLIFILIAMFCFNPINIHASPLNNTAFIDTWDLSQAVLSDKYLIIQKGNEVYIATGTSDIYIEEKSLYYYFTSTDGTPVTTYKYVNGYFVNKSNSSMKIAKINVGGTNIYDYLQIDGYYTNSELEFELKPSGFNQPLQVPLQSHFRMRQNITEALKHTDFWGGWAPYLALSGVALIVSLSILKILPRTLYKFLP